MRYKCLVLDHDDTLVSTMTSSATTPASISILCCRRLLLFIGIPPFVQAFKISFRIYFLHFMH